MLLEESVMDLYEEALLQPVKSGLVYEEHDDGHICLYSQMEGKGRGMAQKKEKHRSIPWHSILLYMKEHIDEVSLASPGGEFYVSEGYLSRYFRRETGIYLQPSPAGNEDEKGGGSC